MNAGLHLAESIHAARLDADMVLLDARRGQYYCLPEAADAFAPGPAGRLVVTDPGLWGDLRALELAGDIVPSCGLDRPPIAAMDLPPSRAGSVSLLDRWDGLASYGTMLRRYYGRPFGDLIDVARDRRPISMRDPGVSDALVERVAAFRQLLPWAPFPGVCLYRSFMLLAFLRRAGFDATWMFGVRTWPFEAHCWLQVEDTVLDDLAERVGSYTPILAV